MTFTIEIAEERFTVDARHPDVQRLCRDYLCDVDDGAGARIAITPEDIEGERIYAAREALLEGFAPPAHTDGALEATAVHRQIADWLSHRGAAVMHGALIALKGRGYLFTAPSGTGKTTHILNWLACFPDAVVVNGDKPVLRFSDNCLIGYGTPWCGKEGMNENASVPVAAVVSLRRAEADRIVQIAFKDALPDLMSAVYRPKDAEGVKRALQFVSRMDGAVPFFRLGCTMAASSARVAHEALESLH